MNKLFNKGKDVIMLIFYIFYIFFTITSLFSYFGHIPITNDKYVLIICMITIVVCVLLIFAMYKFKSKYKFRNSKFRYDSKMDYYYIIMLIEEQKDYFIEKIEDLKSFGLVYLIIGFVVGVGGIFILLSLFFIEENDINNMKYASRSALFVATELMAYFFLRLYNLHLLKVNTLPMKSQHSLIK